MKTAKVFLALSLVLSLMLLMIPVASLYEGTEAVLRADCAVTVSEQNIGTPDYYVAADATFTSDNAFTAGIFTVEAEGFVFTDCTVTESEGGQAPEISADYDGNKVIFTGFSNSTENDFRSYTKLTLRLKFAIADGTLALAAGSTVTVSVKDINIANVDEERFVTGDATGTLHIHNKSETWTSDSTGHWYACSGCDEIFDFASHTESDWIVDAEATAEADGHRHKECTVCGYHTAEEIIKKTSAQYIPGDINGDETVDNKDLIRLFQYLSEWGVEVNADALDVNGDQAVDNKDLIRLFQYLSEWNVEIF